MDLNIPDFPVLTENDVAAGLAENDTPSWEHESLPPVALSAEEEGTIEEVLPGAVFTVL